MTNPSPHKTISQSVLEKIRSGSIHKRPHAYFVFRIIAAIVVGALLLTISAFVISFMLFSFHESGEEFLIGFGLQGIFVFLKLFPWMLFLVDMILLFVLEWLLQGFKLGYRIPLLNIFLGIFGLSIFVAILINATPLHGFLLQRADQGQLPVLGGAYEHIFDTHEDQGVCRGIVVDVNETATSSEFVIQHNDQDHDVDDGQFTVSAAPGITLPPVHLNDRVLVFGEPSQGHIQAHNVQILSPIQPH